jgi:hypothetical protein
MMSMLMLMMMIVMTARNVARAVFEADSPAHIRLRTPLFERARLSFALLLSGSTRTAGPVRAPDDLCGRHARACYRGNRRGVATTKVNQITWPFEMTQLARLASMLLILFRRQSGPGNDPANRSVVVVE